MILKRFKDIEKQILELNELGVAGYKTYLISGMETFKDLNLEQMKHNCKLYKENRQTSISACRGQVSDRIQKDRI